MIVIPAIDLRGGHCVQLVGGDYANERVRLDDPPSVAREWTHTGFSRLHVVDLDAATARGTNAGVIREILRDTTIPVQVGGGVRDQAQIEQWLNDGATWVVIVDPTEGGHMPVTLMVSRLPLVAPRASFSPSMAVECMSIG